MILLLAFSKIALTIKMYLYLLKDADNMQIKNDFCSSTHIVNAYK